MYEFLDNNYLEVLNDGRPTYVTEYCQSALDVTACKCNQSTKWKVDDSIRSDHQVIITDIGENRPAEDWKLMDWEKYEQESVAVLKELATVWESEAPNSDMMNSQLTLLDLAEFHRRLSVNIANLGIIEKWLISYRNREKLRKGGEKERAQVIMQLIRAY